MKQEKPVLVVFAGPNGSGKSSITNQAFQEGTMPPIYINADDITKEKLDGRDISQLSQAQLDKVNVEAANEADQLRKEALKEGKSFATETVMSTPSKIEFMREAKAKGYHVHLVYVTTQSSKINLDRVQDRINKGGHAVPPEKTQARYESAMQLLPEAIQAADTARVYNNSFEDPRMIMKKMIDGEIKFYPRNPPDLRSKWTAEKLESLKQEVMELDKRFKAIDAAPDSKTIGKNPSAETLYTSYAKTTLSERGSTWSRDADQAIMKAMIKDGRPPQRVIAAMHYSPSMSGLAEDEKTRKIDSTVNAMITTSGLKR